MYVHIKYNSETICGGTWYPCPLMKHNYVTWVKKTPTPDKLGTACLSMNVKIQVNPVFYVTQQDHKSTLPVHYFNHQVLLEGQLTPLKK